MPNKLKDIFSNKKLEFGNRFLFQSEESKAKFLEALEAVYKDGEAVQIEGVSAIQMYIRENDLEYPLIRQENLSDLTVYPHKEPLTFNVDTDHGKKNVVLNRVITNNGIILDSPEAEIVYIKLRFSKSDGTVDLTYQLRLKNAKRVKEIADSYLTTIELLNQIFSNSVGPDIDKANPLGELKKGLHTMYSFFYKLSAIEEKCDLIFDPAKISNVEDKLSDVEELFQLLVEKHPVRLNAKLTATESTAIILKRDASEMELGHDILLAFRGTVEYSMCDQNILLYTANLVLNAIIKDIVKDDNGNTKVLYDGTDSKPMYISYTGYKTEEEAKSEMEIIVEKKEEYAAALTIPEYFEKNNR